MPTGKGLPYKKLVSFLLVLTFPFLAVGLSTRVLFSEWFIDYEYSKKDFPKDRWGMSESARKELAKLGLEAVMSEEGLEKFKSARLPAGRLAFSYREVKHMEDVNRLLSVLFPAVYGGSLLWLVAFLALVKDKGGLLLKAGIFSISLILAITALVLLNYQLAFEVFHNFVFDPVSWRFSYRDTLLRIYPMKFWFDGTVAVILLSLLLSLLALAVGLLLKFVTSSPQ